MRVPVRASRICLRPVQQSDQGQEASRLSGCTFTPHPPLSFLADSNTKLENLAFEPASRKSCYWEHFTATSAGIASRNQQTLMGGRKVSDSGIGTGIPSPSLQRISDDVRAIVLMPMAGTEYIGGSLTAEVLRVRGLSSAPLLLLVDPCR